MNAGFRGRFWSFCEWNETSGLGAEAAKGGRATVEVRPDCRDEWIDEAERDWLVGLFKRKTFNLDGSVAVRIPKVIVDALSIGAGTPANFTDRDWKVILSNVWGSRNGCFRSPLLLLPVQSAIRPPAA